MGDLILLPTLIKIASVHARMRETMLTTTTTTTTPEVDPAPPDSVSELLVGCAGTSVVDAGVEMSVVTSGGIVDGCGGISVEGACVFPQ